LHPDDRYLWEDPSAAFGDFPPGMLKQQFGLDWEPPPDALDDISDGQRLSFAGIPMDVRHTPGHTPGSSIFLVREGPLLVSGDLIFAGSVGRTDFPRGSWEQQMESIRRVVLPLEDDTVIVSGHGNETTVGAERSGNPFLRDIA
jgi:hydroxyacylglutathione hydrolase